MIANNILQDVILYFAETAKRWAGKSPKYMRILQRANSVIGLFGWVPLILQHYKIILTPMWMNVVLLLVAGAGTWGVAMTGLTVKNANTTELPYTDLKNKQNKSKTNENESNTNDGINTGH